MRKSFLAVASTALAGSIALSGARAEDMRLWEILDFSLKQAKYIDLTHSFSASIPVWPGFGHAQFRPAVAGAAIPGEVENGEEFTYAKDGFVASAYDLPTDQYGTQLDPPAHWDEYGATISDLPATYAIRPLVVIDIHEKVAADPGYHATVDDIRAWEAKHGRIPEGSVVIIRSDWSKKWNDPTRFNGKTLPGVGLDALKFLHLERRRSCSTATSRSIPTPRPHSRARPG